MGIAAGSPSHRRIIRLTITEILLIAITLAAGVASFLWLLSNPEQTLTKALDRIADLIARLEARDGELSPAECDRLRTAQNELTDLAAGLSGTTKVRTNDLAARIKTLLAKCP